MSYEVRVWFEDGTLMGYAEVTQSVGWYWVDYFDVDPSSGYAWTPSSWATQAEAENYAREWAEGYAAWCREYCTCGTGDCGVMHEHGISIQYCRDAYTTDQFG